MSFNFVIVLVTFIICDIPKIKAQQQQAMNCPNADLHFEKILGIRPAGHHQKLLLIQANATSTAPFVTQDCLDKCRDNEECLSFLLDYKSNECYWYRREVQQEILEEDVVPDDGIAWFVRTCLKVKNCANGWKFERIPGAILIGNNTRKLPDAMTRQQCQQRCLDEDEFICRSCKFRVMESVGQQSQTLGICVLSDTDRHLTPNAYRVSSYSDEYFENQCANETNTKDEFCSFEEFDNAQLSHTDNIFRNRTKLNCQNLCDKTKFYHCRAYSVIPEKDKQPGKEQKFQCKLHSEDSKVHGPRLLIESEGAKYYERVPCLNITVNCTDDHMTVRFQPEVKYSGRIYMQGFSENQECYAEGAGHAPVILKIPLTPQKCGIVKAKSSLNSTLLSSTMILQYNALVQTQADRVIKVGCIFGNESKVILGAGFNFSQENPSSGSISVNSSTGTPPRVQLRVIDLSSQNEVSDTQIGEELQLIIELEASGPYDIWAGHLVAMTENGQDSILLLDDRGCPTNLDVFPALTRITTNDTVQLVSTFQAFKFSSSNVIRFSVMVQFCVDRCPQMDCGISLTTIRKRDIENDVNTTEIARVSTDDQKKKKVVHEMPLEFVIVVRNGKLTADKLVYGENNKILVAGYDYVTNEVCLDYFLIIALIITWIIIQIIFLASGIALIRKYKKHYQRQNVSESLEDLQKTFQYGNVGSDNRRVHFLLSVNGQVFASSSTCFLISFVMSICRCKLYKFSVFRFRCLSMSLITPSCN